ncbi:N-acetylmuramoyl-L-alanine amidase [Agromyces sp. NPDC056965]|uniref:N-acetylmuramoyl-L-alanine amidase n=1 Tax=Agromyces sp. NPDC056965 TaxID=3345983 RepID=UPI00363897BD
MKRGVPIGALALLLAVPATVATSAAAETPACGSVLGTDTLPAAFAAASTAFDVPEDLLAGLSYTQSRWDGHDGAVSADGGYGMFNLLDHAPSLERGGTATDSEREGASPLDRAAELTGLDESLIMSDDAANVCGAAALLAEYAGPKADADVPASYASAIDRFSDSDRFSERVFATIRAGAERNLADGTSVALAADPTLVQTAAAENDPGTDCPVGLGCEWIEAPYAKSDPAAPDDTGSYGNHDLADRTGEGGPTIDYIVIHGTEGSYSTTLNLVQDPDYLAWNYTLRSSDGHVAQHLDPKDVGWHAGNWYVNMHSIGLEHEGYAGTSGWFTEAMYQSSAALVKHLAGEYDIPLDRAHIIGHDQIPGTVNGNTASQHWDPGPYWDWDHYFELLGAPLGGGATTDVQAGDLVSVVAGSADNVQTLTGCSYRDATTGAATTGCATDTRVNYVDAYAAPSTTAQKATDPNQKTSGSQLVSNVASRITSGAPLVVVATDGEWVQVSWAGADVWVRNPAAAPVLRLTTGATLGNAGAAPVSVYGRAYPEAEAYAGTDVGVQGISALEATIAPGQSYVVADDEVAADYYNALTFDGSIPGDRTDVVGTTDYDQLWFAHRFVYAKASELALRTAEQNRNAVEGTGAPTVSGSARVGSRIEATTGTWSRSSLTGFVYQWLADGTPIDGATESSLTLTPALVGSDLSVRVTTADPVFAVVAQESTATRVQPGTIEELLAPKVAGRASVGRTLTVDTGAWSPEGEVAVQWLRDGEPVRGATKTEYRLKGHDLRHHVSVRITVTAPGYASKTVVTDAVRVTAGAAPHGHGGHGGHTLG